MPRTKKICIVYNFVVDESRADFLTNIPIRLKKLLQDRIDLMVLYAGQLNEIKLKQSGITINRIEIDSPTHNFQFLFLLRLAKAVYGLARKKNIDIFINANNHYYYFFAAFCAKLAGKKVIARITGILDHETNLEFKYIDFIL